MKRQRWFGRAIAIAVASGLGIMVALVDRAAPFGDDSSKSTIVLWLACSGLLGFAMPVRPWRWALLVGPWLSAMYLMLHALGSPAPINPNTVTGILILLPFSLTVCSVGAYAGALARRLILPPSGSMGALPGAGS
jgi:hypothetical protein